MTVEAGTPETYQSLIEHLPGPADGESLPWLKAIRQKAFERFRQIHFPTRKLENWKYTPLDRILKAPFVPLPQSPSEVSDEHVFDKYNLVKEGERRIVFINGIPSERYSLGTPLPAGVILEDLGSVLRRDPEKVRPYLAPHPESEANAFAAVNTFSFQKGFFLWVPPGTEVPLPVHLVFAGVGRPQGPPAFCPRVLVVLGEGARLQWITSYISISREPYFLNGVLEIYLGKGSRMEWTVVQRQAAGVSHVSTARCFLEESSSLRRVAFLRGGDVSHYETQIHLRGENASNEDFGLAVLKGDSRVSQIIDVHHERSHGRTRQLYKNILADQSQAEFNSLVHVYRGTRGSDSDQLNRNLILSEGGRAWSRPQLQIDADDVQATHGSATGQLDARELFYLQSRGLDLALARFVLTYGFAEEILEKMKPDSIRWQLELLVRQQIEAMVGPK